MGVFVGMFVIDIFGIRLVVDFDFFLYEEKGGKLWNNGRSWVLCY